MAVPKMMMHISFVLLIVVLHFSWNRSLINTSFFNLLLHKINPWFNYRATKYLSENGWHAFFHWFDRMSWYPIGRPVGTTIYPGLQITAVAIHRALEAIGKPMSLNDVCCLLPVWSSMLTITFTFLLSLEVLEYYLSCVLTALILSVMPVHISVSMAGEFDRECIAAAAMSCAFYFWVKSVKTPKSWPFGIVAGLAYGYLASSWGGYVFAINVISFHAAIMAFVNWSRDVYSPSLLKAYSLFFAIGTSIAVWVPCVGLRPFKSVEQVLGAVVFVLLILLHLAERKRVKEGEAVEDRKARSRGLAVFVFAFFLFLTIYFMASYELFFTPLPDFVRAMIPGMVPEPSTFVERREIENRRYVSDDYLLMMFQFPYLLSLVSVVAMIIWVPMNPIPARVFALIAICFSIFCVARCIDSEALAPLMALGTGILVELSVSLFRAEYTMQSSPDDSEMKDNTNKKDEKENTKENKQQTEKKKKGKKNKNAVVEKKERRHFLIETMGLDVPLVFGTLREKSRALTFFLSSIPLLVVVLALFTSGIFQHARLAADNFSTPGVIYVDHESGKPELMPDYLHSYNWLKDATPEGSRVLSTIRSAPHVSGAADRISFVDDKVHDPAHQARLAKIFISSPKEAHRWLRHLADYVMVWAGKDGDIPLVPFYALIANDFYLDVCPADPECTIYFPEEDNRLRPEVKRTLLYQLSISGSARGIRVDPELFEEVFTSMHGLVRIYKVMNVSDESKAWIADPANHVCSEKEPWICPGQYPPVKDLDDLLQQR